MISFMTIQSVLEVFTTELKEVRFGEVDADALTRAAADVATAAAAVAAAEETLGAARAVHDERADALVQLAQRALAYARVYAEPDAALTARLDAIALPRSPRRGRPLTLEVSSPEARPAPRPRGRPRKSTPEPTLPPFDAE